MKWPIVAYTVMACATIYSWTGSSWFTQHPISMIVAFVGLASNATLIKKIGGYEKECARLFLESLCGRKEEV